MACLVQGSLGIAGSNFHAVGENVKNVKGPSFLEGMIKLARFKQNALVSMFCLQISVVIDLLHWSSDSLLRPQNRCGAQLLPPPRLRQSALLAEIALNLGELKFADLLPCGFQKAGLHTNNLPGSLQSSGSLSYTRDPDVEHLPHQLSRVPIVGVPTESPQSFTPPI